jgi:hypothetical protein
MRTNPAPATSEKLPSPRTEEGQLAREGFGGVAGVGRRDKIATKKFVQKTIVRFCTGWVFFHACFEDPLDTPFGGAGKGLT